MSETVLNPRAGAQETRLMRAITRTKYGSPEVLQVQEIDKPVPDELRGVLVKVYASSVNPADRYDVKPPLAIRLVSPLLRMGMGVRKPKQPGVGSDAAGRVEAISDNVTQFKAGDEVFGAVKNGYAEYGVAREGKLALKPANISFEQAAALPIAATTALQAIRDKGNIKPGHKVLVNGAGGGVGTYAVQIAKALGGEVTAVTNTANLELVKSLGADYVIDYTKEDFAKNVERYDLICDIAASHSITEYKNIMNPNGIVVIVGIKTNIIRGLLYYLIVGRLRGRSDKKFRFFIANINQKDLAFLAELQASGKLRTVIGARYSLNDTPEAIRHLIRGVAQGKIVITVRPDSD